MSVTYEVYEYDPEIDEEALKSLGVIGGLVGKLSASYDVSKVNDLLQNADSCTVGRNTHQFPEKVNELIQGIQEVDDVLIDSVQSAQENLVTEEDIRHNPDELIDWLEDRKGEKVFVVAL